MLLIKFLRQKQIECRKNTYLRKPDFSSNFQQQDVGYLHQKNNHDPTKTYYVFIFFSFFRQSLPSTKATTPSNSRWRWSSGSDSSRWYKIAIPNRICSLQWRWRGVHFIRSYWCHKCYYRYFGFYWHRSLDCSKAQIHTGNKCDNMAYKNYHGNANGVLFSLA